VPNDSNFVHIHDALRPLPLSSARQQHTWETPRASSATLQCYTQAFDHFQSVGQGATDHSPRPCECEWSNSSAIARPRQSHSAPATLCAIRAGTPSNGDSQSSARPFRRIVQCDRPQTGESVKQFVRCLQRWKLVGGLDRKKWFKGKGGTGTFGLRNGST
jgi:hypothetical protein